MLLGLCDGGCRIGFEGILKSLLSLGGGHSLSPSCCLGVLSGLGGDEGLNTFSLSINGILFHAGFGCLKIERGLHGAGLIHTSGSCNESYNIVSSGIVGSDDCGVVSAVCHF